MAGLFVKEISDPTLLPIGDQRQVAELTAVSSGLMKRSSSPRLEVQFWCRTASPEAIETPPTVTAAWVGLTIT